MRFFIILGLFCSLPFGICAETLTLDKALASAFIHSPFVSELQKNRLNTFGAETDDTALLSPELEWEYDVDSHSSDISFTQPLRLSDLTLTRFDYKKLLETMNRQEERLDALRLYHRITLLYCETFLAQEELKYTLLNQAYLEKANETVTRSLNRNGISKTEAALLKADTMTVREEAAAQKWHKQKIFLDFGQQIGLSNDELTLEPPPRIQIKATLKQVLETAQNQPSYQYMLNLQEQQAAKKLSIAKQDAYFPILEPKIKYGYDNEENQDSWQAGLTLTIPLWNHSNGRIKALKAEEAWIKTQQRNLEKVGFETLIKNHYQTAQRLSQRAETYFKEILPLYEKSIAETEEAFNKGEASVLVVWQAKEKWTSAQTAALLALKEAYEAKAVLEIYIGSRLEDIQ